MRSSALSVSRFMLGERSGDFERGEDDGRRRLSRDGFGGGEGKGEGDEEGEGGDFVEGLEVDCKWKNDDDSAWSNESRLGSPLPTSVATTPPPPAAGSTSIEVVDDDDDDDDASTSDGEGTVGTGRGRPTRALLQPSKAAVARA